MKRNTIFHHLFIRVALILLGINIIFSLILLPIYNDKLVRMLAVQGDTFANSTIAACGEALYTEDFSFVISYINKVLHQTPEITYVTFTSNNGLELLIKADRWNVSTLEDRNFSSRFNEDNTYEITHANNLADGTADNVFVFSKPINISGLNWGVFTLGLSDSEYESLLSSYIRNIILFTSLLMIISLLLLHGSSLKLGQQLSRLGQTATKLASGDLTARAPTDAIGEIDLLASTLNSMAESLEINTRNVRQLARLVEDTNDAIAIFDNKSEISFVNPAFMSITNHDFEYYQGMSLTELLDHLNIDRQKQREVSAGINHVKQLDWSTDITIGTRDQGPIHMTLRIEEFETNDQAYEGFFVVLSDITRRKQLEFELETLAYIDKLTKLPNRRFFMDRLAEEVPDADDGLAIFFLDLDNFKIINDSLGHEVGDFVLSEAAWRIQDALRSDDIVCRLGGDEFTVIIKGVEDKKEIARIADALIKEFELPIYCNDRELRVSTSIGIVQYPNDGNNPKELIKNADTAMYAAKRSGKNAYRFFSQDMHRDMQDFLEIEGSLRKALESSGLSLVYQPFIDLDTRKIHGCEALIRWQHPQQGNIPPGRFIPIAEQTGLIVAIGQWVLAEVCRQMKQWNLDINVSINISGTELLDKHFIDRIQKTLIDHDIDPYRLKLEFTEHVLISKDGKNLALLNQLKRLGFQLVVDDFGTGFSSLSYLAELPVDVIKIDKSFISRLPLDRRTIAVVNSIISLAQSLDIRTIGEGAETRQQVDWLKQHGCNTIQGYYFHKPMPAADFERLLKSHNVTSLNNQTKLSSPS